MLARIQAAQSQKISSSRPYPTGFERPPARLADRARLLQRGASVNRCG